MPTEAEYPESDGKPIAETPMHRDAIAALIDVLRVRFAADPMMYVSGAMLLYYERGKPRRSVAPDVFVARVRADVVRRVYKAWEEGGRGPELVVEVTSSETRDEDLEDKFGLYRDRLCVPEYFLFDALRDYLDPPLQGFRLVERRYEPIDPVDGRLPSAVLGLHFEVDDMLLRLYDPVAGETLLTSPEARARAEQGRRDAERARIQAEEAIARLRREIDVLHARSRIQRG